MADHPLYVRFPDDTIRYGLYRSSCDLALPDLVDTYEATQQPEYYTNQRRWNDVSDGPYVPVDVATNYGRGFAWRGTATPDYLATGCDPFEDGRQQTGGLPAWVTED